MVLNILSKFFDTNRREIDRIGRVVEKIESLEKKIKKFKTEDFPKKTEEFKKRIKNGEALESLLPEVFAVGREAAWRAIGLRPYKTQLIAGVVLAEGKIAEQKTGEGKTLSAVLPLFLHSLTGRNVHLVTVNDYLARRDAGWNGPIFNMLGLTVGVIIQEGKSFIFDPEYKDDSHGDERLAHLRPVARKEAYQTDIVYGTNNEFGFDYLRDNMVSDVDQMVQRGHYYAIIDEVDSVLIDEARTPLIISAPDTSPTDKYYKFAELVKDLVPDTDFVVDEKLKTANLTERGIAKVEKMLGVENLYEKDFETIHHIENALRARTLYLRDRDYVVKDGQVIIVDEFTGRLMFGRRWSDGLHQAIEAKENVPIQQESKTLATISFQNYFRMYEKLAGMTGTAATEAEEFYKIYGLEVVVIPTYKPIIRKDYPDVIYKTARAKYTAIVKEIEKMRGKGRPVLVGTTSIEKNEIISQFLKKKKIPHNVLNAKNHEKEAMIIAEAGKPGAVTVATNMAGRGVDIILGGDPPDTPPGVDIAQHKKSPEYMEWKRRHDQVIAAGGLHVIGTERHESRRIDNQLRGRAGRLGDPGSTRFFLSLEDDLMRIFGGERIAGLMETLKIPEDQPIENKLISKAIEQAQIKVETFHFEQRKRVVEYDDVANQQREIVYKLRRKVLESKELKKDILEKLKNEAENIVDITFSDGIQNVDYERIIILFSEIVPLDTQTTKQLIQQIKQIKKPDEIKAMLVHLIEQAYTQREKELGQKQMREIEKFAYLSAIDNLWVEHLTALDDLREGVGLRGYGQKDPLVEFKNEAFELFEKLMADIDATLTRQIFRLLPAGIQVPIDLAQAQAEGAGDSGFENISETPLTRQVSANQSQSKPKMKIGRNDPCWCGSGKKWKKCCYPRYG